MSRILIVIENSGVKEIIANGYSEQERKASIKLMKRLLPVLEDFEKAVHNKLNKKQNGDA